MRKHPRAGSIMLEFILVMPILFVLIMGVLQFAHIWTARQVVKYAAYSAARAALVAKTSKTHEFAYSAARQVCAWISFSNQEGAAPVGVSGWGNIPNSSSVNGRLNISVEDEPSRWRRTVTVDFDFPLLMPVVGKMLSYLAVTKNDDLQAKLESGEVGFFVGRGWSGQENKTLAFPTMRLTESCTLPLPYRTTDYPSRPSVVNYFAY